MSRAAFARHMGVSPRTITDRIRAGTVVVDRTTNKIKVRESKARWLAPGPALGRGDVQGPDPERGKLTAVRTQHEQIKRQAAELRLRKARGELIDRQRTLETVFNLARETRDSFLSWPARYAAIIAARLHTDPHATELALDQCVKAFLRELAEPRITL